MIIGLGHGYAVFVIAFGSIGWRYVLRNIWVLMTLKGLYTVSLIEGDGIGPEISQSVKDIFAAAKVITKKTHKCICDLTALVGSCEVGTSRRDPAIEGRQDFDQRRDDREYQAK